MTILVLSSLAAVVNIALNVFLIPRFGVMGAVYATLGSAAVFGAGSWIACPRDLLALPNLRTTGLAFALGVLVWWVASSTNLFGFTSHHARLAATLLLELGLFAAPALLLDRILRSTVLEQWQRWRGR
jgi:O-antigen/teichoic acid export membrane protein